MRGLVVLVTILGCGSGKPPADPLLRARTTACASNLQQLGRLGYAQLLNAEGVWPRETGSAFWRKMTDSPPKCPVDGSSYRGPAKDANFLSDGDPLGACIGHHPDGSANVLRKSGSVETVRPEDPLYRQALQTTAP